MKVRILKDDPQTGVKKGEVYRAERFSMDETKVSIYDADGKLKGGQYLYEVEVVPDKTVLVYEDEEHEFF